MVGEVPRCLTMKTAVHHDTHPQHLVATALTANPAVDCLDTHKYIHTHTHTHIDINIIQGEFVMCLKLCSTELNS